MVAVIHTSHSLRNAIHYNENKLKVQAAKLIHSINYGKDTERLGFTDKINRLEKLAALNERVKVNSLHISLNFDPSEKLPPEKLQQIADSYMQKIGFAEQPYLVYEHTDAGHPHIHIVSTNIRQDGSRISLHNIGRNQSETARKEIENEFKLVPAQKQQQRIAHGLKPVNVQKVQYGKSETKRAITNVLDSVLPVYKYTSLPELNAILKQYNVIADRGSKDSRIYKANGLVYRALNEKGEKIGAPVKASDIYNKPTLAFLEQKFVLNEKLRLPHKQHLKNAVGLALMKHAPKSIEAFTKALQQERIQLVVRQNDNGIIYGLTYIDYHTKSIFNGSDLGKEYSANAIQQRLQPAQINIHEKQTQVQQQCQKPEQAVIAATMPTIGLPDSLIGEEKQGNIAFELREDLRKKRKRKRLHQ